MAKVCISKSIFPNKALNAFISCVSKHSLKQEFSSAVLREGKACLTLLPSFCAAPCILFPGGIEAVGTIRIYFVIFVIAELCCRGEGRFGCTPARGADAGLGSQDQKWALETPPSRNKSQEITQSCDYSRWIKKEECYKKQKEKGAGEGDRARVGFAWLGCWLKLILSGAAPGNDSGKREHSGCAKGRSFRGFPLNAHSGYKLRECSWVFCISICEFTSKNRSLRFGWVATFIANLITNVK